MEKMFRHQKGAIVQASKEQVRAMSRRSSEGGGHWPFGESSRTFNLLGKRPSISSRHGQLFEADAGDYRELEDLDIQVSFTNITGVSSDHLFFLFLFRFLFLLRRRKFRPPLLLFPVPPTAA